jgi:hypothetical protein
VFIYQEILLPIGRDMVAAPPVVLGIAHYPSPHCIELSITSTGREVVIL